jgi:hypothetical protein
MSNILKNLGWKPGNADYDAAGGDFRECSVSTQIRWSLKYLNEWRARYKFAEWKRPGDLYLCNFAPANLPHKDRPEHIIFHSKTHPQTHWVNRGLDNIQAGHATVS